MNDQMSVPPKDASKEHEDCVNTEDEYHEEKRSVRIERDHYQIDGMRTAAD